MEQKISEWQDLSLKKDVEIISKNIHQLQSGQPILTFEVFLAILSIVLDNLIPSGECNKSKIAFIVIGLCAGIGIVIYGWIRISHWVSVRKQIKSISFKIKPYVDLFDNYICYYAMTANSFYEDIKNQSNSDVKEFYFIEANYYVNKCIAELSKISNIASQVFTDREEDVLAYNKIHTSRFENILLILQAVRNNNLSSNERIVDTISICKEYDKHMVKFIKEYNKTFKKNIVWKSY